MGFKSQSLNSLWFPFSIKQIFLSIYLERFWFLFLPIEPSIRLIGLVSVFVSPWHHRTIIGHLQREKSRNVKIFLQFEKWFAMKAAGERQRAKRIIALISVNQLFYTSLGSVSLQIFSPLLIAIPQGLNVRYDEPKERRAHCGWSEIFPNSKPHLCRRSVRKYRDL